jgi:uncharacterized protein YegP (UPF0339 family)
MEIDGYLPCESYSGHKDSPSEGFVTFTDEKGENYFAMVGKDGSVLLRSEGYPTVAARDNGLASVQKNREIKERYKIVEEDGQWYVALKAGNHQEIARSCGYASEADALARFSFLKEGSTDDFTWNLAPVAAAVGAKALADAGSKSDNEEDDYLVCGEYRDRIADSKLDDGSGFIAFQHKNGKYYFGVLDAKGDLQLRSEGYPTVGARDNGIASVKKNIGIDGRWSTEEKHGFHFNILKAGNGQEIARSCPYKDAQEAGGKLAGAALAAAGTVAAAASTFTAKAEPEPIVKKVDVVAPTPVPAPAPAPIAESFAAAEETSGGIGKWLPWLLGALLLGGLLWWLMKGCNKPAADVAVADTTAVMADTTSAVAADTAKATEETVAPVATTGSCNCTSNAESIFNIPTDKLAKKLPRLGTNPEFARYGNIHKMSGAQFLQLLKGRAAKSDVDKAFLDRVTKAMGYSNGISDVSDANISEHTFPVGTKGNLGWGAAHNTAYDELPDAERDRVAFKIAGNGGCAIYFMKTCGNHMVPSTNCD